MRKSIFIFLLLNLTSPAQQWKWAYALSAPSPGAWLLSVDTDTSGNPYFVGTCSPQTNFNGQNGSFAAAGLNVYVASYDPQGNINWLSGGKGSANARGFATDGNGNCFISGDFNRNLSAGIGSDTLQRNSVDSTADGYLVKLDKDGKALLFNPFGANCGDAWSWSTALRDNGVVVSGYEGSLCNPHYASYDGIIKKYDAQGNEEWSIISPGRIGYVFLDQAVATPDTGFLIAGIYDVTPPYQVFGTNGIFNLPPCMGGTDFSLVKYSSSGEIEWLKTMNGEGWEFVCGLTTDPSGNIFFGVSSTDTAYYDGVALLPEDIRTTFLIKVDLQGNLLQYVSFPSEDPYFYLHTLKSDAKGNIYLSLRTAGDLVVGADNIHFNKTVNEYAHAIMKLDNALNYVWSQYAVTYKYSNTWTKIAVSDSVVYCGMYYDVSVRLNGSDLQFVPPTNQGGRCLFSALTNSDGQTGIKEKAEVAVNIFPNPSPGKFYLAGLQENAFSIKIFNSLGESIGFTKSANEIDLGSNAPGIYFVEITVAGKRSIEKIIISK